MLINKIITLDDTYTLEELKNMSVRELYRIEYQLSNPDVEEDDYPWNRETPPPRGN